MNAPPPTSNAPASVLAESCKAVSMSRTLLTSRTMSCCPDGRLFPFPRKRSLGYDHQQKPCGAWFIGNKRWAGQVCYRQPCPLHGELPVLRSILDCFRPREERVLEQHAADDGDRMGSQDVSASGPSARLFSSTGDAG